MRNKTLTLLTLSLCSVVSTQALADGGWIQNETEFRHFRYDYDNAPSPFSRDEVEVNKKLLQGMLQLTEGSDLWLDLRRIDYFTDNGDGWFKNGYHWDHEAHLRFHYDGIKFLGRDWKFRPALAWEGDWNFKNTSGDLNWSSNDYYLQFDLLTSFPEGLTPWDNGRHTLNFRPLLTEYIVLGETSKFHNGGHYRGHRQQVMNFFLVSQWNERFSSIFSFRNYLDTMAKDGIKYHYGSENETWLDLYKEGGFKVTWHNKLEFYLGMDDSSEVLRDKFVEFYTRLEASYSKTLENGVTIKGLVGQDLWDYHYNDSMYVGGDYGRSETIATLTFNVPLGK